ncbi:MAG: aminotransferase class IV, partial [Myxococcales bacterium]|nr:aminotransferase class IV [Myxococcales bacterium]
MSGLWASVDGRVTPAEQAVVPALDRGFLFGDAVYEVFSTRRGRPLFWAEHLDRLRASGARTGLAPQAIDGAVLRAEVAALCAAVGADEAYVRLMVSRGVNPDLALDPREGLTPTRVLFARPLTPVDPALKAHGCVLSTTVVPRRDDGQPVAKKSSRQGAIAERLAAHAAGAYEALRVDTLGRVLEGATSTFFAVRAGVLLTPPLGLGILDGITRRHVLAVARAASVPVAEAAIPAEALDELDEAFICSSTRGV